MEKGGREEVTYKKDSRLELNRIEGDGEPTQIYL